MDVRPACGPSRRSSANRPDIADRWSYRYLIYNYLPIPLVPRKVPLETTQTPEFLSADHSSLKANQNITDERDVQNVCANTNAARRAIGR